MDLKIPKVKHKYAFANINHLTMRKLIVCCFSATNCAANTIDLNGPFLYRALKAVRGTGECCSPDFL